MQCPKACVSACLFAYMGGEKVVVLDANSISLIWIFGFGVLGLWRGLVNQVFSWLAWTVGLYLVYGYATLMSQLPWLLEWIAQPGLRWMIVVMGMVVVIALVSIIGQWFVSWVVLALGVRVLDRLMGFALGLVKGGLLLLLVWFLLDSLHLKEAEWLRQSWVIHGLTDLLPIEVRSAMVNVVKAAVDWI